MGGRRSGSVPTDRGEEIRKRLAAWVRAKGGPLAVAKLAAEKGQGHLVSHTSLKRWVSPQGGLPDTPAVLGLAALGLRPSYLLDNERPAEKTGAPLAADLENDLRHYLVGEVRRQGFDGNTAEAAVEPAEAVLAFALRSATDRAGLIKQAAGVMRKELRTSRRKEFSTAYLVEKASAVVQSHTHAPGHQITPLGWANALGYENEEP